MSLKEFVGQIGMVYQSIARRIEDLLLLLNELPEDDQHAQVIARRINDFLGQLEKSVNVELRTAAKSKQKALIRSIRRELGEIHKLEAFIALSGRKPKPEIIRQIAQLYKAVQKEINQQEALVR